jgi:hypothetical protein
MKDPWAGTVLIPDDEFDYDPVGSYALREIISGLKTLEVQIITSPTWSGGADAFLRHPDIGCVLLDYHLDAPGAQLSAEQTCQTIRHHNQHIPIFRLQIGNRPTV